MSLLKYSSSRPLDYYSNAVSEVTHNGFFGETGVYYDPEGISEVGVGDKASPTVPPSYKPNPSKKSPTLKILWLLLSSMLAVEEGSCLLCPSHNGLYPHVNNCKCYYKCINGIPIQKSCPPGQKFDVMSMSCTFPTHTVCAGSLMQMLPAILNNYQQQNNNVMQQQMQGGGGGQQMQGGGGGQLMQGGGGGQQMQGGGGQQMQGGGGQQMQGGGGNFHITLAFPKSLYQGNMMQMMQMLMTMMKNQQGMNQGMMNQNMGQNMGQGGMNQNMMGQNMGQGGMNQNMMGQNMGQGGMNQNMMGQNMGQGGMNQNMMGQNMGQQGGMGQNMMNQNMMQQGGGGGSGGGMGNMQQCITCNRPKKELTITYHFDFKKLPIRFKLFG